jgi:serine/threonine-protein kinase
MTAIAERLAAALSDRYAIQRELGQGGMATVYLAHDLKHDRQVALKVLKPELAAVLGAERFVVEIKTTAALQHPHILPLFDSGTVDGFLFYVMPFIDGETLRDRLNRETQLGIDEAVKITTDVADALDYAHRHGVIHRDIKPENILLHDGRPMVADFGIALAVSAAAGGRMTETGLSLGTPHYMSPEQATADKDITARSDIYSLASVLYEMLTGNPPHTGASAQQIIMKIVTEDAAPVTTLRKSVPANVAAAVAKSLEKLAADRFESAKAFADALANPAFRHGMTADVAASASSAVRVFGRAVSWRATAAVAATAFAAVSVALLVLVLSRSGERPSSALVTRAELHLISRSDSGVSVGGVDVSPDGSMIVYAARLPGVGVYNLYLRRIADREAHVIPGTSGATWPAFSPNGQAIAFILDNKGIRRIPVSGVVVEAVVNETADGARLRALRWARDGFLYYTESGRTTQHVSRVPERGGSPKVVLGSSASDLPDFADPLPDGRHVLYVAQGAAAGDVRLADIATGTHQSLGVQADEARYVATGHLILRTSDALKAVAFDLNTLKIIGEPLPVLDSVSANGSVSAFALSRTGTAAYVVRHRTASPGLNNTRVTLVDVSGKEQVLSLPASRYQGLRFSPDGRRLAYTSVGSASAGNDTLFVHDLVLGTTTKRSFGDSIDVQGTVWSRDGDRIATAAFSERDSVAFVASVLADGTGSVDTLWTTTLKGTGGSAYLPLSVSPDGQRLLLQKLRITAGPLGSLPLFDLGVATRNGTWNIGPPYLNADWSEMDGAMSPDGKWVAYASDEERSAAPGAPRWRVYVRSFPEPGQRFTVSDSLGQFPRWARDGSAIYYWRGQTLVATTVRTTPTFSVVSRKDLFARPLAALPFGYDVHPDGKRFVMAVRDAPPGLGQAGAPPEPARLVLVVNWLEEFKRKLQVAK